ncbi:hypothetical protein ACWD4G_35530 [Streptomyces sp. NPDC002643]
MHGLLTGSRLLTLSGVIARGVYGEYGNARVDAKVNAYLESGELPTGNQTCRQPAPSSSRSVPQNIDS